MNWEKAKRCHSRKRGNPEKKRICDCKTRPPNPDTHDLADVRRIVLDGLRNYPAKVYLFGSWAKGKARKTSDIDVAVFPSTPLPPGVLSKIRETLEESRVLYKVDVVDLTATDPLFRTRVLQEGISWND